MSATINERIERIQHAFDGFAWEPKHQFDRVAVPEEILAQLAATGDFPQDYLSLLRSVGTVAQRGLNGCAMIDWWVPCSMSEAVANGKCFYDIRESNFVRGEALLLFAWDCRARVYFYDTTKKPWSVVSSDGLSLSSINEEIDKNGTAEYPGPFECDDESCALEIIEDWVECGGKCERPILPQS